MLAGKNESGKTNVLNAILTAYNDDFEDDDVPVSIQDADPTVKLSFKFNSKYIEKKLGVSLDEQKNYTKNPNITAGARKKSGRSV